MSKHPRYPGDNVTPMPIKTPDSITSVPPFAAAQAAPAALAGAGSSDDPRMKEALRLIEAFLAIEDAAARASLVTLAERLVSYDWVRRVQKR